VALAILSVGLPSLAWADCVPADATTVVCSNPTLLGNPYTNNTNNLQVTVQPGGQVAPALGIGEAMTLGGNNVNLTNNGTVDASLLGLAGVLSGAVRIGNGTATSASITNTGILRGTASLVSVNIGDYSGVAVDARVGTGGRFTLNNSGTIGSNSAVGVSVLAGTPAIVVSGGGQADITNTSTGTIVGRVGLFSQAGGPGNTFVNAGTISGSVSMGRGDDTFTAMTGSHVDNGGSTVLAVSALDILGVNVLDYAQTGVIDGGAGTDALNLAGIGEDTASNATYQNFENLNVQSGRWHVLGLLGSQQTTLSGGTAVVRNGADLGPLIVGNGGALEAELNPVTFGSTQAFNLQPGGLTVQGDAQPMTIAGVISGPGALTKNGQAELDVTGANTYAGGTVLNAGTLGVGGPSPLGTGALSVNGASTLVGVGASTVLTNPVHLNAALTVQGSQDLALFGPVDGPSALIKDGPNRLTLQGGNTYAGGTTLNDGTLTVRGLNALGSGPLLVNGGALDSDDLGNSAQLDNSIFIAAPSLIVGGTENLTLTGDILGPNGLTKNGPATLNLTNPNNTFTGPVELNAGTLNLGTGTSLGASNVLDVNGNSTLGSVPGAATPLELGAPQTINLAPTATLTLAAPQTVVDGTVAGDGALNIAAGTQTTLNGANTYAGGTSIQPTGSLIVGADQALGTGPLQVLGDGTLGAPTGVSVALANAVTLAPGTLTTAPQTRLALDGPISGDGGLRQVGPGTLALNGANTYAGDTALAAGTLEVGNDLALGTGTLRLQGGLLSNSGPVTLANPVAVEATSTIDNPADLTLTGPVTGQVGLTKDGLGTLTLGNTAGFTGPFSALNGLTVFQSALHSPLSVAAPATVTLSGADDAVTLNAPLAGVLNLGGGTNSLAVPVDQFGSLTGTLNGGPGDDEVRVINNGDGTWAPGTLTGIERVRILSGANVALADGVSRPNDTAATIVEGGLALNGTLGGDATVAPTGTLAGHGTLDGNLTVEGLLAPGGLAGATGVMAAPGTPQALQVNGGVTFQPTSQFTVNTQPDGTSDRLNVSGTATINGGNVTVHPQGAASGYGVSTDYPILTAGAGVNGAFAGVTQTDLPFLTAKLTNDPTHVILNLGRTATDPGNGGTDPGNGGTDPGNGGTNPGNGGTDPGNGGTNPGNGGTDPGNGGTNPGNGGTDPGNGGTNPGNGGTNPGNGGNGGTLAYGDFPGLTRNQRSMANGGLQDQENRAIRSGQDSPLEPLLRQVRGLSSSQVKPAFDSLTGESYAALGQAALSAGRVRSQSVLRAGPVADGASNSPDNGLSGLWVTALGVNATVDGAQGNADIRTQQRGMAVGLDAKVDQFSIGPYLAVDRTSMDPKGRADDGTLRQTTVGLRAQQEGEHFWVRGLVGYGSLDATLDRTINVPGYNVGRAHGHMDGHVLQGAVEAGWKWKQGDWDLTPVAGVYYTRAQIDNVREQGGGVAALQVNGLSAKQTVAGLGLEVGHTWLTTADGQWRLEGGVHGYHNFDHDATRPQAAFAAAPVSSFGLVGNPASKQWVEVNAGVRYAMVHGWSFSAGYGVALGGREKSQGLNLGVSLAW
jgi:outer membrane autotransporter protein